MIPRAQERLRSLLGTPELEWLVERLRRRFEQGEEPTGQVVLQSPSEGQREAVGALLGRRGGRGAALVVPLGELEEVLVGAGLCASLRDAIERLVGPVEDQRELRRREAQGWEALYASMRARAAGRAGPAAWVDEIARSGVLKRITNGALERAQALADEVMVLASTVPAEPVVGLAELAAKIAGDAHALDVGAPLGALGLRLVARLAGMEVPEDADGRREAWAGVGVLCDELSAPVLVLGLRAADGTHAGRALCDHAEAGEPYRLSTRQLVREAIEFAPAVVGGAVHVCENPSVVIAAANLIGRASVPLVCVEGMPKVAARLLLGKLARAGIELRYHGDFDWPGVRIANLVMQRHGARPWRMWVEDYREAASGGIALEGDPVEAAWDAQLAPAMLGTGRVVHEERVLESLIEDLKA